jgi:hypothetical protein
MAELARLATHAESESARIAAGKEILDRAYGKAPAGDNFTFVEALKNLDKLSDFQLAEIVKSKSSGRLSPASETPANAGPSGAQGAPLRAPQTGITLPRGRAP